jgi:hypothetical protein
LAGNIANLTYIPPRPLPKISRKKKKAGNKKKKTI